MSFIEGERLKTIRDFQNEITKIWKQVSGNHGIQQGSQMDVLFNMLANVMYDQQRDYYNYIVNMNPQSIPRSNRSGCSHDFKDYVGLTESYKYCTKCGDKESK